MLTFLYLNNDSNRKLELCRGSGMCIGLASVTLGFLSPVPQNKTDTLHSQIKMCDGTLHKNLVSVNLV